MYTPIRGGNAPPGSGGCPLGPLVSFKALGAVFLPSFLMFVAADLFWIGVVAGDLYAPLKPVLREKPDAVAALLSWLCIVLGNYAFVLPRTGGGRGSASVVGLGALFGLLLYGTVDLTNAALVKNWDLWPIACLDMCWGSLASALLALAQRTLASTFPSAGIA